MWSSLAYFLAAYNLFNIRQRVLKHSIYLIKSNNKYAVGITSVGVGLIYYFGLIGLWNLPSFAA
jgi:hypothetical protein